MSKQEANKKDAFVDAIVRGAGFQAGAVATVLGVRMAITGGRKLVNKIRGNEGPAPDQLNKGARVRG